MRKAIILIFVFFIVLNIANAEIDGKATTFDTAFNGSFSGNMSNYTGPCHGSLEGSTVQMGDWSNNSAIYEDTRNTGMTILRTPTHANITQTAQANAEAYVRSGKLSKQIPNGSRIDMQFRLDTRVSSGEQQIGVSDEGGITAGDGACRSDTNNGACIEPRDDGTGKMALQSPDSVRTAIGNNMALGQTFNVTMIYNGSSVKVCVNNSDTSCVTAPALSLDNLTNITIGAFTTGNGASGINVSWFCVTNASVDAPMTAPEPAPLDTAPPSIDQNSYNMTSGGGCTNWRTDKGNPCSTSDTTPTVNFTTNEAANCAIGTQDINVSNYTSLVIDRNCTIGQGTSSHTCTLKDEDELVYENSTIYIACSDLSGNQNKTSTSGALALSITGLEAAGRTSIGIGIQNALLSSYTNYTDLQIYARNLSNSQLRGTFDRAAKKGSKMWAFNRIGVSDSYVNMFNLTPVLYTLELANKTSSNITLEVEKLINATK